MIRPGKLSAALAWIFVAFISCLPQATAEDNLTQPTGRVILSISGDITNTNNGDNADFDLDMLHALGTRAMSLTTSWTDGTQEFRGVLMRDLMAAIGAKGKTVEAIALNDYTFTIDIEDFSQYPVIVATSLNGKILKIRDKGPLWIIYPLDTFTEEQKIKIERRMVWQLRQLIVR
ncbi:MAG: molybdopterin-dependent oxidoreductase [Proteobacteria bacterium]|nr:molybdopterin-dependent oxidoreductase [Pseudomonadota bacterium]